MLEFIRSNILKDHVSATETIEKDLPTNPLSHLVFTICGEQTTDEATLAEIIAFLNTMEVTQSGKTILSCQSEDLYGVNCYLYRHRPMLTNAITTDDAIRNLTLIVPFGRKIFDPAECFPATKKGELTLRANMTVLGTSISDGLINIEAVELVGATPARYLKTTQMVVVGPGATGDNDIELPIGNKIVAVQIRMTTFPTTATDLYGVTEARILVDNKEFGYACAKAPCLVGEGLFRMGGNESTMLLQQLLNPLNIVWLDFAPRDDDEYLLDTAGKSSVKLRLTMGVNEATYVTILELVNV
jgi:hypothetical protein